MSEIVGKIVDFLSLQGVGLLLMLAVVCVGQFVTRTARHKTERELAYHLDALERSVVARRSAKLRALPGNEMHARAFTPIA